MGDSQLSLIPRFSHGVRKSRVRSRCFSQPFAKLRALLTAEMIDKAEESIHPVAEVMPILLKSGQSASQEEAVEKRNGLQPPEHLSSDLLHYEDDLPGHAGLLSHHVQESKSQPCLAAQYRSMSGLKYLPMSDGRCRSTKDECLWSMVVSECRSTGLVPGSTVADENQATNKFCCRLMRNVLPCGLNAPSLQDLMRIAVKFPCFFWYCWACT
ncbi:hypothetical protein DY000_02015763 [Brassica cretica]|uniref:Uncharacterized protein n=1 Tax=Brassica cretica TaxID=69181 RepID=A0ABQ7CYP1_BRACR|nr:hypothetical protein DY000_02015763 [Brassica cretica]